MRRTTGLLLTACVLSSISCGRELDEPCNPQSDPGDCDGFQDYVCVSCESHGYASTQGYCYMKDYTDTVYKHICEEAWGAPGAGETGGTDSSCSGDTSGCQSAWTGSTTDHAQYNCQAACYEKSRCNEPGIKANCDILSSYGADTVAKCTTCR